MKKGISIWSFPAGMSLESCMELAQKAGFEGIELALEEVGEISLDSKASNMKDYADMAKYYGLDIVSLATGLYWKYSFSSNDKNIREKAHEIALKQIELACELATDTILLVPGAVGADFITNCEIIDYDIVYDRALESVTKLENTARSNKIKIGIENVWNKFLLSPLEMRDFIDKIGSEFVGAYLDIGNTLLCGYPEHWIKILAHRIKKVHFKDYRIGIGNINGFVDLLAGDVNFPEVIKQLNNVNYCGYVTAEMIPPVPFYRCYSDQIIWNASASMDRILNKK